MDDYEVTITFMVSAASQEDAEIAARDYFVENDLDAIVGDADVRLMP